MKIGWVRARRDALFGHSARTGRVFHIMPELDFLGVVVNFTIWRLSACAEPYKVGEARNERRAMWRAERWDKETYFARAAA